MSADRNPFKTTDVRADTAYVVSCREKHKNVTRALVFALKPCGCDGPYLGALVQVKRADPQWAAHHNDDTPASANLWEVWPDAKRVTPITYVWGMESAARALRQWWAVRNLKRVLNRSKPRAVGKGAGR